MYNYITIVSRCAATRKHGSGVKTSCPHPLSWLAGCCSILLLLLDISYLPVQQLWSTGSQLRNYFKYSYFASLGASFGHTSARFFSTKGSKRTIYVTVFMKCCANLYLSQFSRYIDLRTLCFLKGLFHKILKFTFSLSLIYAHIHVRGTILHHLKNV